MPTESPRSSRIVPAWLWPLAIMLLLARIGFTIHETQAPPAREERLHWRANFEDARAEAKLRGKPLLLEFSADWCGPCQLMQQEVFADREAATAIEQAVIPVRLVDRQQEEGHNSALVDSLQRRFAVDGFPTLVVVDPNSDRSEQTSGYGGRDATVQWIARNAINVRFAATHP